MSTQWIRVKKNTRRRAVVAVQVGVLLVVLLGTAALTIDVGAMFNVRADLQRTADAGALAGASAYISDAMMTVRMGTGGANGLTTVVNMAKQRSAGFSYMNPTYGTDHTHVALSDIVTGWINPNSPNDVIHTNPQPRDYNVVEVTAHRSEGGDADSNGPVEFLFASIFGRFSGEVHASAAAIFDDRFAGVRVNANGANILPFTIHEDAFLSEMVAGGDQYGYNAALGEVNASPDGIREIRLYPYPLSGDDYEEGDGNFGVLNIGTGNQGVDTEIDQILNGVSDSEIVAEIGTSDLTFFGAGGAPVTYDITGSPGLEATLKDPISSIIGQEIGFFLHNNVVLSGSNAIYTITQIRYGRVMDIRLTGPPNQRGFFIQPISYAGGDVVISPDAPSSGGLVGRLVLVR